MKNCLTLVVLRILGAAQNVAGSKSKNEKVISMRKGGCFQTVFSVAQALLRHP